MNPMGMCVEADRLDRGKLVDETACCAKPEPTLYDLLGQTLVIQEAAQEHLSCAFAVLGIEPYKREQGCGCCDTIDDMAKMLYREMGVLNGMAVALESKIGRIEKLEKH